MTKVTPGKKRSHAMSDSSAAEDADSDAERLEHKKAKKDKRSKKKNALDLQAIANDDNFEVWLVHCPAKMEINRLQDMTFDSISDFAGPFEPEISKHKRKMTLVSQNSDDQVSVTDFHVKGEVTFTEKVDSHFENPVSIWAEAPKFLDLKPKVEVKTEVKEEEEEIQQVSPRKKRKLERKR